MRHGKKDNHLGRTSSHRNAMLRNMASSLILHKRIKTTVAKAKELKKFVEPLLTKSKDDNTTNRRVVFSYLPFKEVVKELFSEVADKIADRPGGYTRIIKLGTRQGDNAEMCVMELVDFNETMLAANADKPAKTRRSRRGGSAKTTAPVAQSAVTESPIEDAVVVEEPAAEVVEEVATVAVEEVVEVAAAPAEVAPVAVEEISAPTSSDDLKIIEGIGPKIASVLADAGVTTFAQLADMTPEAIKEIVSAAGVAASPTTWPQQATLARDGQWDELKTLQDELNGGRA